MLRYICSLPNPGVKGAPRELFYTDDEAGHAKADAFVLREDKQPGRGIYYCIGKLRDDARSRCKDTVGAVDHVVVDLDLKNIEQPRDEVMRTLCELVLPPTEIRDSGFGLHADWYLKERLDDEAGMAQAEATTKRLVSLLAGDPAPTHRAALMRLPGTHNTKDGTPRRCHTIWESDIRCDVSEFDEVFDLYGDRPLLTRKETPKSNGHSPGDAARLEDYRIRDYRKPDGTLDVEAWFAAMPPTGPGVHHFQPAAMTALLCEGHHPEEVIEIVAANTVAQVPGWDLDVEVGLVTTRIKSTLSRLHEGYDHTTGVIPEWVHADFRDRWIAILDAHNRPQLTRNAERFYVRGLAPSGTGEHAETHAPADDTPGNSGAGDSKSNANSGSNANPRGARPGRRKPQKIEALPFKAFAERDLPAREFLYGKHYQRGQCTCSVGQDGAGKSTVSIAEAIVMCTGRNLLGEQPVERCRVWLHNADDDSTEMNRRIAAFCKLHGVPLTELEGWLFVTGKDNFKIKVVRGSNGGSVPDAPTVGAIIKTIQDNAIDVAMFDPLIHLHTVPENNNTQVAEVADQFADIASVCECSTDIVHHVRKIQNGVSEKEFTSEDSRGGGALRAAVRALRVYNRMTTTEAEDAGIPKDLRGFYLRVDRGKANYLPPAVKSTWFHLASIVLDNGDDVGAIEPWTYPGQDGAPNAAKEATQKRVDMLFLRLLAAFTLRGDHVSDAPQAVRYAPKAFAATPEALAEGLPHAAFAAAMERLKSAGRVRSADAGPRRGRRLELVQP
jgi:hypothetical protein